MVVKLLLTFLIMFSLNDALVYSQIKKPSATIKSSHDLEIEYLKKENAQLKNEQNLKVIGLVVTIIVALFVFGQFWAAIYPIWEKHKKKKILNAKFRRGPYDKATIQRSTQYYLRPKCSNIDPAQEKEIRHALVATREDLFTKIDNFLDHNDNNQLHLLILADSGTGKTSFVLNYFVHNNSRSKKKRKIIALVPLGVKNSDDLIEKIPDKEDTVIFLDAFDEDVKARDAHHKRIMYLMKLCSSFRRVVITCRTQFFPKDEEIPVETGILKLGPIKAGEKKSYEFWKLYLSPFDDDDVKKYLKMRYPFWHFLKRRKANNIALKIPLLTARPMLLAHIPDVIKSNKEIKYSYQLYEVMIDAWLERETHWVNKTDLRLFSEYTATEMFINRENRGTENIPSNELPKLAELWKIKLQKWQISGRSLLNRDALGNHKFAHRSIMEYLFVTRMLKGDHNCYNVILTDQMKIFLIEIICKHVSDISFLSDVLMDIELSCIGYQDKTVLEKEIIAATSNNKLRWSLFNPLLIPRSFIYLDKKKPIVDYETIKNMDKMLSKEVQYILAKDLKSINRNEPHLGKIVNYKKIKYLDTNDEFIFNIQSMNQRHLKSIMVNKSINEMIFLQPPSGKTTHFILKFLMFKF